MNNPVWQDPKLLKLWMLCLLEASHKEHEQLIGKQIIKLYPGQFVTGRFSLSKAFNDGAKKTNRVEERTLWRWMKMLETYDFLTIKSNTKFSVITIKNWDLYQHNDQPMSNKCPTNDQPMSTNNNGNKGNNDIKDDDNMQTNPISEYEKAFGFPTSLLVEEFNYWIDSDESQFQDPEAIICETIQRAKQQIPRNPAKYITKILKDLHNMELFTLEAVQSYNERFDKQRNGEGGNHAKKHTRRTGRTTAKNQESITGGKIGRL